MTNIVGAREAQYNRQGEREDYTFSSESDSDDGRDGSRGDSRPVSKLERDIESIKNVLNTYERLPPRTPGSSKSKKKYVMASISSGENTDRHHNDSSSFQRNQKRGEENHLAQ